MKFKLISFIVILTFIFISKNLFLQSGNAEMKIIVNNLTDKKIAIFYDNINTKNYLGNLEPSKSSSFTIGKNPYYVIIHILYSDYQEIIENPNMIGKMASPFTNTHLIYAYNNGSDYEDQQIKLEIFKVDNIFNEDPNQGKISFINMTDSWIEIREGGAEYGTLLATIAPHYKTTRKVAAKEYYIYPTYYMPIYSINNEIIEYTKQNLKKENNSIWIEKGELERIIFKSDMELISDQCYLYIENYNDIGYTISDNSTKITLKTFNGITIVERNTSLIFHLDAKKYSKLLLYSNARDAIKLPEFTAKPNHVYRLIIGSDGKIESFDSDGITLKEFLEKQNKK